MNIELERIMILPSDSIIVTEVLEFILYKPLKQTQFNIVLTCKSKEHASWSQEVVSALPKSPQEAETAQGHEGQTEDGDSSGWDVVLWQKKITLWVWIKARPNLLIGCNAIIIIKMFFQNISSIMHSGLTENPVFQNPRFCRLHMSLPPKNPI